MKLAQEARQTLTDKSSRFRALLSPRRSRRDRFHKQAHDESDALVLTLDEWSRNNRLVQDILQLPRLHVFKGNCVSWKKLVVVPEFQVRLYVKLHAVPREDRSIAHFCINGDPNSHLPSLMVLANSTVLAAKIQWGNFTKILVADEGIHLGVTTEVRLQVYEDDITFIVGNIRTRASGEALRITSNEDENIWVYLSSPTLKAARATVSHVTFYSHREPARHSQGNQLVTFQLPPADKETLDRTNQEIAQTRKWARYDAFFGVFVVANSVLLGLEAQNVSEGPVFSALNNAFLILFMIELVGRFILTARCGTEQEDGKKGIHYACPLLFDFWFYLDLTVIMVSVMESWWAAAQQQLPSFFTVLRLFRLLKLAKVVRLVGTFKELGLLVEGLLASVQTLGWTLMLLGLVLYCSAILVVRLVNFSWGDSAARDTKANQVLLGYKKVLPVMWKLCQMATLDNWMDEIRLMMFTVGGIRGQILAAVLGCVTIATGLGIINMVVGILCQTAFDIESKQHNFAGVKVLETQQQALGRFRQLLKQYGQRPLFKSDKSIGTDELFEALDTDEQIIAQSVVLALSTADFVSLCDAFEEGGEVEIDGLCEAIGIMELQTYYSHLSNAFSDESERSPLRPSDSMFFNLGLRECDSQIRKIEKKINSACTFTYDALAVFYERAAQAYTMLRMDVDKPWNPPAQTPGEPVQSFSVAAMKDLVSSFVLKDEETKLYMPLDVIGGVLIMLSGISNGVQVGVENPSPGLSSFLKVVEFVFTALFILELFVRTVLCTNFAYVKDAMRPSVQCSQLEMRQLAERRFRWLESKMTCFGALPPMPPKNSRNVIMTGLRGELKDGEGLYHAAGTRQGHPFFLRAARGNVLHSTCIFCEQTEKMEEDGIVRWCLGPDLDCKPDEIWAYKQAREEDGLFPPMGEWIVTDSVKQREEQRPWDRRSKPEITVQRFAHLRLFAWGFTKMMRDLSALFDMVLITLSALDTYMLSPMRDAGLITWSPSALSCLRVFRLLRFGRLLRVFKLFPQLNLLVYSFAKVWRTVFWILVLMCLLLYSYGIYMFTLATSELGYGEALKPYFGSLPDAIMSGWQIATYDDWESIVFSVTSVTIVHSIPSFILIVVLGMGFMKIAVGVMCEAALSVARKRQHEQEHNDLVVLVTAMSELREEAELRLGTPYIPKEVVERALDVKLRARVLDGRTLSQSDRFELPPHMISAGLNEDFLIFFENKINDAKMSPELVKKIFDKMDYNRTGYLSVDQLAKGGLLMKEERFGKIDLFAAAQGIMELRRKCSTIGQVLLEIRMGMEELLKDMRCLMYRTRIAAVRPRALKLRDIEAKQATMPKEVNDAIEDLAKFREGHTGGKLAEVVSLGKLKIFHGSGEINVFMHEVHGHQTNFRREVHPGDILIIEKSVAKSGLQERKTFAMVVSVVVGHKLLKVQWITPGGGINPKDRFAFSIVRAHHVHSEFSENRGDITLTLAPPPASVTPRSAQRLFDWEVKTRNGAVLKAWGERSRLWEDYIDLQKEIKALVNCELLHEVMRSWRSLLKRDMAVPHQQGKGFLTLRSHVRVWS